MAAVYFTTIPCEINTAHFAKDALYVVRMCSRINDIDAFGAFLRVLMSVGDVFLRYEL